MDLVLFALPRLDSHISETRARGAVLLIKLMKAPEAARGQVLTDEKPLLQPLLILVADANRSSARTVEATPW